MDSNTINTVIIASVVLDDSKPHGPHRQLSGQDWLECVGFGLLVGLISYIIIRKCKP